MDIMIIDKINSIVNDLKMQLEQESFKWTLTYRLNIFETEYLPKNKMWIFFNGDIFTKPGWSKYISWMLNRLFKIKYNKESGAK